MRTSAYALLLIVLACIAACGAGDEASGTSESELGEAPSLIVVQIDPALPRSVGDRIEALVRETADGARVLRVTPELDRFAAGDHVLAIGDVAAARLVIEDGEAAALSPEGFVVRSTTTASGARILAARGKDAAEKSHYARPNRGTLYGAYAALEAIGFGFLHPLAPTKPARFEVPARSITKTESPRWHVRGIHLHTMHPLELTNFLNGWGTTPEDRAGWEAQLPEWDRFLEWMIANRQNQVEWVLLEAKSWQSFALSDERLARLTAIVTRAHEWGIDAGADTPMALQQQHSFKLVEEQGELATELASIHKRVDWLMKAGYDFLATENGTTEFTHADPARMLAWMNEIVRYMHDEHDGRHANIKVHCSTGQNADGFTDPTTGGPLNVNFLPHYADAKMGVLPHSVQHYGIDDAAPTYGNQNFEYMRKFLQEEVGRREVVWHPETAYWVSFDVDVPLFLPIYAERRVHDLRLLAGDAKAGRMGRGEHAGKDMDGQMIFSSGWEWSYWLNDVVAARAVWNPHEEAATDLEATRAILDDAFNAFGAAKKQVVDALLDWMHDERELLIYGRDGSHAPSKVELRNGQAYMQGWEVWDDVSILAGKIPGVKAPKTQPDHLGLVEMRIPGHGGPGYSREIEPLLAAMERVFAQRANELAAALAPATPVVKDLADEMIDAARITALRAKQVHGLYDYVDKYWDMMVPFSSAGAWRKERLKQARLALDEAQPIVTRREARYRVPAARIASWGNNPTAYEYGYLWTVHSLLYWWRDEGKAVDAPATPCYLNIVNPADVALGEGGVVDALRVVRKVFEANDILGGITPCLAEPATEPTFPQDNLRSRPRP
ncbi:MAG: hypothetical protein KIT84_41280 [Labilithrix sp.]|nr:hypothetical protein [Labilithrix sp.]MCW5817504.1 hypothetical protein [Labilithrix sp.]